MEEGAAEDPSEGVPPAQRDAGFVVAEAAPSLGVDAASALLATQAELLELVKAGERQPAAELAGKLSDSLRALQAELLRDDPDEPDESAAGESSEPETPTPRTPMEAFPELSNRLAEIVASLGGQAELSGIERQALVAERIKLESELASRQSAATLARLLADSTIERLMEALFAPETGAADGARKLERMERKADAVELLVNAKQGRAQLAETLHDYVERSPAVPPRGFDCICSLVNDALSSMVDEAAPIFDELVMCSMDSPDAPPRVSGHLDWRTIGSADAKAEPPMGVELLAMPIAHVGSRAGSSAEDEDAEGPTEDPEVDQYCIIRTLDDGTRQYGFCAPLQSAGARRVLCVLSRHPWFGLWRSLLPTLVNAVGAEVPADGVPAAVVSILDALWHTTASAFPMPGERFTVAFDDDIEPLHLTRANDEDAPLVDADFTALFERIGVAGVLAVYTALLAERHVLFVSASHSRLCECIHASLAMIYPFIWQHILVAILPESWLDYVTAPMPFVLGVDESLLDRVLELPIEQSLLIVKIDSGEIAVCAGGEGDAAAAALPASIEAKLEKGFTSNLRDLQTQRMEPSAFNRAVLDAVTSAMVGLLGSYREHLEDDAEALDVDGLVAGFDSEDTQAFLGSLRKTQLFDAWQQERVVLKAQGYPQQGLFETLVSEHDGTGSGGAPSVDVMTARHVIDAALVATCGEQTLLDRVRQHDLWKNTSLWQRVFEEKLSAEAQLEHLTIRSSMMSKPAAAPSPSRKPGLKRRASITAIRSSMKIGGGEKDEQTKLAEAAAAAAEEERAKALKREAGHLSQKIVQHSETMMRFGLPLDLVERLATKVAANHNLSSERTEKDVKEKVHAMIPRFVHLQDITKEGWLEVEAKGTAWDVRWFRIRDTSLCIHESDTHADPSSVFPCAACSISEPKSKRKGKDHAFRIDVASYAVASTDADSGTASKHVALKLIVNASSSDEKESWYKHLQDGGAFVPTIGRHTLKGDAKAEAVEALANMSAVGLRLRTGADQAAAAATAKAKAKLSADRESAMKLFGEVDEDSSGHLNTAELKQLAAKLGLELDDSQAAEAMAAIDVDGDESVDFEEFFAWYQNQGGAILGQRLKHGGMTLKSFTRRVERQVSSVVSGGADEEDAAQSRPEDGVSCCGMLEKKGARARDGYKRRWFELKDGDTLRYLDKDGGKMKGEIGLGAATVKSVGDRELVLALGGRDYQLRAADTEKRETWVVALGEAIAALTTEGAEQAAAALPQAEGSDSSDSDDEAVAEPEPEPEPGEGVRYKAVVAGAVRTGAELDSEKLPEKLTVGQEIVVLVRPIAVRCLSVAVSRRSARRVGTGGAQRGRDDAPALRGRLDVAPNEERQTVAREGGGRLM